jgi:hypothetical protein
MQKEDVKGWQSYFIVQNGSFIEFGKGIIRNSLTKGGRATNFSHKKVTQAIRMIRSKKILVSIFFLFFLTFVAQANEPKGEKTKSVPVEKVNKSEIKKDNNAIVVPNLKNDQWQIKKKRFRIPREFEGTMPLLSYKEQQIA